MKSLIAVLLLTIICWVIFGKSVKPEPTVFAFLFLSVGTLGILVTVFLVSNYRNGLPVMQELKPGTYKVGFVYRAGDNVSVGIEKKGGEKENLYFHMFPRKNFEGMINPNDKKLKVFDDGSGYYKLRLEPTWP